MNEQSNLTNASMTDDDHKISDSDVDLWRIAAEVQEEQGDYESALVSNLNAFKLSCERKTISDHVDSLGKQVIANGCHLLHPPDKFHKQDLLTQLYALACSFHRQPNLLITICTLEAAVEFCAFNQRHQDEDKLSSSEAILMKIYYELACCKEELDQLDESIPDFTAGLHLASRFNDVVFEKMILLRLSEVLMKMKRYEQAVFAYNRLLALRDDIQATLNNDMLKFKSHRTVGCECEIHYNLCVAYKELHLYERALEEGLTFKKLLQTLDDVQLSKPKWTDSPCVSHTMQINAILGKISESLNDHRSSITFYQGWRNECEEMVKEKPSSIYPELVSSCQAIGKVAFKLKDFALTRECSERIVAIGQKYKNPSFEVSGLLMMGDLWLALDEPERAGGIFSDALQLAQASIDDGFATECLCMMKEAEVLAKSYRHSHALYRCEQAISLARKCNTNSEQFERQAAIYSQHSTSEKELLSGLKFLANEIFSLEDKLLHLKEEEASRMFKEEDVLQQDYKSIQVILHRLGENKLSLAFGEAFRRRMMVDARNETPSLPNIELKEFFLRSRLDHVTLVDANHLLLMDDADETIISLSITDAGLLIQVFNPKRNLSYSYLSADHVIQPHMIEVTIGQLVQMLDESSKSNPAEVVQMLYNTENSEGKSPIEGFSKGGATADEGAGDGCAPLSVVDSPPINPCEGDGGKRSNDKVEQDSKERNPLKELYVLLLQPVYGAIRDLPDQAPLCIVAQGLLAQIPFDQLINPVNNEVVGSRFNVTMAPSMFVLNNCASLHSCAQATERCDSRTSVSRKKELLRSFENANSLNVLEKVGLDRHLMGLVSSTGSGTNIISSSRYPTPYRQVSRYLGITPTIGANATKSEFLAHLSGSTLLHVATYASITKGLLVFRPDSFPVEPPPVSMDRYIVNRHDIIDARPHQLKLFILSSGQSWRRSSSRDLASQSDMDIVQILLSAGVHAVVRQLWTLPDVVSDTFFFHFYSSLQRGCRLSRALFQAKQALKENFVAIGSDVTINLSEIRESEVHRSAAHVEANKLDAITLVEPELPRAHLLFSFQKCLSRLIGHLDISRDVDVITFLLGLVEEATDRLTKDENANRPVVVMPEAVLRIKGTLELLQLVGFDFQNIPLSSLPPATRNSFSDQRKSEVKMVVFPHWNQDELLLPIHQALTGLLDVCNDGECVRSLAMMLPLREDMICKMVDLLALLHHSPHLQLHTTDQSVSSLWKVRKVRDFLRASGVSTVRSLLLFSSTINNKTMLVGSLQILLSLCCQRGREVLKKINLETLGMTSSDDAKDNVKNLKSFRAVVMPRNEILVTSSWMSEQDDVTEGAERKEIARRISQTTQKYARVLEHAKWWHQDIQIPKQPPQASTSVARPNTPRKVKVLSGSTPSCNRVPLESRTESHPESLHQVLRRREEARNILHKRCVEVKQRHTSALRSSYLPYVE